ncbi:MAG: glycosyltransferase family 2 protein [Candidatus Latescibacter sp.]|nr:glycosyltransferase family 2 protein [Candidatus Latescibacter sp.]
MKTCVIIPAYCESRTIGEVLRQVRAFGLDAVVIDDGSDDGTDITARENGALVIINETNEGKGASLAKGFSHALYRGYDAVITMDGDGQHLPEHIPEFIRLAESKGHGILIGNRRGDSGEMPFVRLLTNRFMSWLISRIIHQEIPDSQCGFRFIKREVLEQISLRTSKFDAESEILFLASDLGFTIGSVPIKTVYSGEKSKINPLIDTFRFLRLVLRITKHRLKK